MTEHIPTPESRRQVSAMAGFGLGPIEICAILAITARELDYHYRTETKKGRAEAEAQVRQALFKTALGSGKNAVKAMELYLKQNAGEF